jgi:hypothetical protein
MFGHSWFVFSNPYINLSRANNLLLLLQSLNKPDAELPEQYCQHRELDQGQGVHHDLQQALQLPKDHAIHHTGFQ